MLLWPVGSRQHDPTGHNMALLKPGQSTICTLPTTQLETQAGRHACTPARTSPHAYARTHTKSTPASVSLLHTHPAVQRCATIASSAALPCACCRWSTTVMLRCCQHAAARACWLAALLRCGSAAPSAPAPGHQAAGSEGQHQAVPPTPPPQPLVVTQCHCCKARSKATWQHCVLWCWPRVR
jgi:hypothetical protein